jgi:outer membrane protein assembly factor BamB
MNLRNITIIVLVLCCLQNSYSQDSVCWKYATGSAVYSSAAISGNSVFLGSGDMNLYSLNKTTGALQWKFETKGAVQSTPAVSAGKVFVASGDGNIYAVNENNGKRAWSFKTGGEQRYDLWDYYISSPMVVGAMVYVGSGDSCVYALDAETGKCIWKYKTNGIVHATPAFAGGVIYIGSFDGNFYALDASNGKLKWKFKTVGDAYFPLGEIQKGAVITDNTVIFGSRDYNIYTLDAKTGTGKWNRKESGSWIIATPMVYKEKLYFGTSDSPKFYCTDIIDGSIKWSLSLNMRVYGTAVLYKDKVYFGCFNGKLYGVNYQTGTIEFVFQTSGSKANYAGIYKENDTFRDDFKLYGTDTEESEKRILELGSILSTPVINEGIIYFGDSNGFLYAIRL